MMKPNGDILILDVPDRRSIPIVGSLGKDYNFCYLVPIRKGFSLEPLVKIVLRLLKPRYTRHMQFIQFDNEKDIYSGLLEFLQKRKFDLVIAFSERSTAILCEHASELEVFTQVAHGSFEDFNTLNDKYSILEICKKVGVPTPRFVGLESRDDIQKTSELKFPLVVKCRLASGVKEAFRVCHSTDDIHAAFDELTNAINKYSYFPCDKLVAEEFIKGSIFDAGFVVNNGKIVAAVTQERVWTIPPEGGFGAYNITREIPELVDYGKKIFRKIQWKGPAQLEFILDEKDHKYKLIEINPRFWGTTGLAVKAGVNIGKYAIWIGMGEPFDQKMVIAPPNIDFAWLLQEALTAERMRGLKGNIIWRHLKKIISRETNNFSYSIGANILLALPHILPYEKYLNKKRTAKSLSRRLFE